MGSGAPPGARFLHDQRQRDHHRRGHVLGRRDRRARAAAESGPSRSARARSATCTATGSRTSASPRRSGRSSTTPAGSTTTRVFPGKKGWAARRIETEDDVHDVIALIRLNYDRVITTHGVPPSARGLAAGVRAALGARRRRGARARGRARSGDRGRATRTSRSSRPSSARRARDRSPVSAADDPGQRRRRDRRRPARDRLAGGSGGYAERVAVAGRGAVRRAGRAWRSTTPSRCWPTAARRRCWPRAAAIAAGRARAGRGRGGRRRHAARPARQGRRRDGRSAPPAAPRSSSSRVARRRRARRLHRRRLGGGAVRRGLRRRRRRASPAPRSRSSGAAAGCSATASRRGSWAGISAEEAAARGVTLVARTRPLTGGLRACTERALAARTCGRSSASASRSNAPPTPTPRSKPARRSARPCSKSARADARRLAREQPGAEERVELLARDPLGERGELADRDGAAARCSVPQRRSRRKNAVVADPLAQRVQGHRAARVDRRVEQVRGPGSPIFSRQPARDAGVRA